jgi:hypothetical protein
LEAIKITGLIKEETVKKLKMLPQFYLDYLKTYLPNSELLTLQILVWLLQAHRQVRIVHISIKLSLSY